MGGKTRIEAIHLLGEKANRWDYIVKRGYLTPRQVTEATEYAKAAMRRAK